MGSSKGGSSKAPKQPQPAAGGVIPYGQTGAASTRFNPQYTSFLPTDGRSAMLNDPSRIEFGQPTPLLEQQDKQAAADKAAAIAPGAAGQPSFYQQLLKYSGGGGGGNSGGPWSSVTNIPSPGKDASPEDQKAYKNAQRGELMNLMLSASGAGGGMGRGKNRR